ncbi:MAG TPA: hypothetical protein VG815_07950 [Chloroflexota bacterium]|nr:hypothetical protein [Chloroflexota bacterium]
MTVTEKSADCVAIREATSSDLAVLEALRKSVGWSTVETGLAAMRGFCVAGKNGTTNAHPKNRYLLSFTKDLTRDIQRYHGAIMAGVDAAAERGWNGNTGNHFISVVAVNPTAGLLKYAGTGWSLYLTGNTGANAWGASPTATKPTYHQESIKNFYNNYIMDNTAGNGSHPWSAQAWTF